MTHCASFLGLSMGWRLKGEAGRISVLRSVLQGFLPALVLALVSAQAAAAPLRVVASFSILADMVRVVGGEDVHVEALVGPRADAHSFEPSPADTRRLAQAQVLVVNGLSFEAWLPRLLKASQFKGQEIVASMGVIPRRLDPSAHDDHDDHDTPEPDAAQRDIDPSISAQEVRRGRVDPHAWQSLENGMIYARNIAEGLSRVDPAHRAAYRERADRYIQEMKKLDTEIRTALAPVKAEHRRVVVTHDAFGYFGQAYGITFIGIMGLSPHAEPSARELADIIQTVRHSQGVALFDENGLHSRLIRQVSRETGIKVGGSLYSDTLAMSDEPADSYLGMFKWNAGQLIYALSPEAKR